MNILDRTTWPTYASARDFGSRLLQDGNWIRVYAEGLPEPDSRGRDHQYVCEVGEEEDIPLCEYDEDNAILVLL